MREPKLELVVRRALPADAPEVERVYVESWNQGFGDLMRRRSIDEDILRRWRADLAAPLPYRWWVAERAGAVVGLVGIGLSRDPVDPTLGELDTIAIDPPHWRTGVGRVLMSLALEHLAKDGYREALLWTLANYPQGHAFYSATGWSPNGATRDDGGQLCYTHPL